MPPEKVGLRTASRKKATRLPGGAAEDARARVTVTTVGERTCATRAPSREGSCRRSEGGRSAGREPTDTAADELRPTEKPWGRTRAMTPSGGMGLEGVSSTSSRPRSPAGCSPAGAPGAEGGVTEAESSSAAARRWPGMAGLSSITVPDGVSVVTPKAPVGPLKRCSLTSRSVTTTSPDTGTGTGMSATLTLAPPGTEEEEPPTGDPAGDSRV
mmetsp:Transcript_15078/g.36539  ORF Transcript_15078/g.36539 Transcript_15078/m.36539 type:complete len:213 (-) Transcript_15078:122-760(-)